MAQRRADIVAVAYPALVGVRRRHAVSGIIVKPAHQQGPGSCSRRPPAMLGGELLLDRLEQLTIENRRMLAETDLTSMHDLADVEAVAQEIRKGTARERDAAYGAPSRERPNSW